MDQVSPLPTFVGEETTCLVDWSACSSANPMRWRPRPIGPAPTPDRSEFSAWIPRLGL